MRVAGAMLSAVLLVLAGCMPTPVPLTGALLVLQASCASPCTYWFEYWADGTTRIAITPDRRSAGGEISETISGLAPDTVYRTRFCSADFCAGVSGAPSLPGVIPDPGDLSATRNYRTAGPGTVATTDLGRPLSEADTATRPISRDGGLSAAWSATESLWLFGDTSQRNGPVFLAGTTAAGGAYARGSVPTGLREVPTPPAAHPSGQTGPAPFLPAPQGLRADAQQTCDGFDRYAASWPLGLARLPGKDQLLIVYAETCVISQTRMPLQRLVLAVYDPVANQFLSSATPFAAVPLEAGLPAAQQLGSPVFGGDGHLYLYANDVETGDILMARVGADPASWADAANYRWWNGQWTPNPAEAVSVAAVPFAGSVQVADYTATGSHRFAMVVLTGFGVGGFQVLEASSPAGPWTPTVAGRVPDPCSPVGYGCYALHGHAELSTDDRLLFSWYSPTDLDGFAHLRVGSVPW
ncbi:hypothetical protein OHA21_08935 [Actinoplanes sp. NBC_00393]|uniref:hypothetical protein n=1 Tax=Actinoplanes sp. NBC_00393 TaxID=2975953 RepID=UPI002E1EE70D